MKRFPKTIYVTRENEGTGDEYLNVGDPDGDIPQLDETSPVAVYQLVEVAKVVVTRVFTGKKK